MQPSAASTQSLADAEVVANSKKLQLKVSWLGSQLVQQKALLQQEQARHDTAEERFLEQNRRATTVNTELIKVNTSLRQQLRSMKAQAGELKLENSCMKAAYKVKFQEQQDLIAELHQRIQATATVAQSTNIQRANDMRAKPDLLRSEGSITRSAQAVDEDNTTDQVALQQHGSGPACYQSSPVHSPSAQLATVPEQHTTANSMPEASSAFLATGQPDQISPSAHLTATENQRNVSTTFSSGSCSDSSPSVLANTLHPSLSSSPTLTSLSLPSTMLLSHPNMPTASALPPSSTVLHLPPPFLNPLFVSQTPLPISGQPIQGPLPISWQPIQDPPPSSAIPSTVISIQTAQDHMTAMAAPSAHSNAAAASAAVTHTQHDAKHIMPEASDTTPSEALQPASSSEDGHNLHKHPINGMSASPRTVRSSSSFDFGADGPTRNGFVTAAARPMPHLLEPSQSMPEVDAHAAFQRTDGSKPASHSGISWQSSSSAEPVPSSTQSSRTVLPSQTTQAISQLGHAHPASQTEQASLQSSQTAAAPHTLQVPSVSQVATNLTPGLIQHVNIVEHQAHQRRKAVQRVIELHPASGNRPSVNGSAQHDLAQRTSQRSDQEPETQGNRTKGMFDSVQDSMPASTQLLEQDRQPSRAERAASTTQHSTPSQHSVTHQQALQSQLGLQSPNQAPRSQPEDRLSRGLQALWNKMSHTPLAVPSTASPQRVSPPLLATAGTSPSVEDKTAQHAAEPDGASAAASSSTTKDEISAVQGLNMPALSAVVTSKREGTNVVSSSVACNGEHDHDMATAAMSASEAIDVDAAATPQLRTGSCATRAGISREAIDNIARESGQLLGQQRRSGRTKQRVRYEEPRLGTKLRKGDAFTFGLSDDAAPSTTTKRHSKVSR